MHGEPSHPVVLRILIPIVGHHPVLRRPTVADTSGVINQPGPIDAGFDRLSQVGHRAAKVTPGRQGAEYRERRINA